MLYHKDKGLPEYRKGRFQLIYTKHAERTATERKIKRLPKWIVIDDTNVIEIEIGEFIKYLVRIPYSPRKDILIAFVLQTKYGIVKTVWLNKKEDHHLSLNMEKYEDLRIQEGKDDI